MYQAIAANKRRTWLIISLFVVIIAVMGWIASLIFGSRGGNGLFFFYIALTVGGVYALIQYFAASKIALAVNGAKQISKADNPRLYRKVENLAIASGLPMPAVYIMNDPAPNAFATGRDPQHAAVCATTGLLEIMDDTELEAVLAHELGHIQNYDIRVMMIVFGLVSAIGLLADLITHYLWFGGDEDSSPNPVVIIVGIVVIILAPFAAMLVQLAVSRRREYLADGTGALLTRYPEGLARALEKIAAAGSATKTQNSSTAHLFFANPLKKGKLNNLFSTHPPVEDRIARLRNMSL